MPRQQGGCPLPLHFHQSSSSRPGPRPRTRSAMSPLRPSSSVSWPSSPLAPSMDHVQRPYLEFSSKRWSLITGLRGYLSSAFFIMGFKVFAPLMTAYVVWPVIGLPALIAIVPFLLGCAAQFAFELYLEKRSSSCWPLLPIIFEMYRVYQLSQASHFIEMLMFSLKESPMSPLLMERGGALVSMLFILQILGVVCLWSLTTFLLRLFPSRPVAKNY